VKINGVKLKRTDRVEWESCFSCNAPVRFIKHDPTESWHASRTCFQCARCTFQWNSDRFRKQFLNDLENKIHVIIDDKFKWIVDFEEDRTMERVKRTMKWAVYELGIIEAEAALVWAMKNYWHRIRTSWVHGSQSEVVSQLRQIQRSRSKGRSSP